MADRENKVAHLTECVRDSRCVFDELRCENCSAANKKEAGVARRGSPMKGKSIDVPFCASSYPLSEG